MKLRQLTIAGFRGFNDERKIDFHDRLTLISAPNSHGKTSISEALEFLINGNTSKVAHADSKDEYKDSYRNRHWPSDRNSYIEAIFVKPTDETTTLRIELTPAGEVRRFVDGSPVSEWPFAKEMTEAASPFILQHALKYLLLVPPTERFQGFARLLGLNDIDSIQGSIVSLCTKPEVTIPPEGRKALADLQNVESRITGIAALQSAGKDLKRGAPGVVEAFKKIAARADAVLQKTVPENERLAHLVKARDDATSKVYSGTVAVKPLDPNAQHQLTMAESTLTSSVSAAVIEDYARLAARDATERLTREAQLLTIGLDLLKESPEVCPFCGQALDDSLRTHIAERHGVIKSQIGSGTSVQDARTRVDRTLGELRSALSRHQSLLTSRSNDLVAASTVENQERVRQLFGTANEAAWEIVQSASVSITPFHRELQRTGQQVEGAIQAASDATQSRTETTEQVETIGTAINSYMIAAKALAAKLDTLAPSLIGPARILTQAIDALAGTGELSLLIDLLETQPAITRAVRTRDVLEGLKELKKHVEQTVGETMESAISADLTGSVMDWYSKLRTQGDPDVHFSGFAMDRTRSGDFKSRRVRVNAHSYGVELTSAVSSLSESKLNALGLCVSIASALRAPGPWELLVLDDPIQSWDVEHECQFIQVIRALIEEKGKQIILLSHKGDWVNQVCLGCRCLNGIRYDITGYTQSGPHLVSIDWAPVDQRLREAESTANDPDATIVRLQQAEEEIRIAACQIAADIAKRKLNRETSPHNMNRKDVRDILNAAGCPATLVDRVDASFTATDDAHHAPRKYQPNAQRIRQYVTMLKELRAFGQDEKGRMGGSKAL